MFMDKFQEVYDSVRHKVLDNMVIAFCMTVKLGVLLTWLNETYSKVWTGKELCDTFPIQENLKQRDAACLYFTTLLCNARTMFIRFMQLHFVSINMYPLLKMVYL